MSKVWEFRKISSSLNLNYLAYKQAQFQKNSCKVIIDTNNINGRKIPII